MQHGGRLGALDVLRTSRRNARKGVMFFHVKHSRLSAESFSELCTHSICPVLTECLRSSSLILLPLGLLYFSLYIRCEIYVYTTVQSSQADVRKFCKAVSATKKK